MALHLKECKATEEVEGNGWETLKGHTPGQEVEEEQNFEEEGFDFEVQTFDRPEKQ